MGKLPSGVPVKWKFSDGKFKKERLLPWTVSQGEVEYVLYMGHRVGHHLCDSYMDGEGQISFVPKDKKKKCGEDKEESLDGDDDESEDEEDKKKTYKKFRFDLVIRSKKEVHSFAGCYWLVNLWLYVFLIRILFVL